MELRTDGYFSHRVVGEERQIDHEKISGAVSLVPVIVTYPQGIHMEPAIIVVTRNALSINFNEITKEVTWAELISKIGLI